MHHLIESYILATELEEKFKIGREYKGNKEISSYRVKIPSHLLIDKSFYIKEIDDREIHLIFKMNSSYLWLMKRNLGLIYHEYSTSFYLGDDKSQAITIKGNPEFIYSKLVLFEKAHKETEEFFQSTFAC